MKIAILSKTLKKISKKNVTVLDFSESFLMPDLIDDSCIFIPTSVLSLKWHIVLVEAYEENSVSHKYVVGKRGKYFNSLFR